MSTTKTKMVAVAGAAALVIALAGCSSEPESAGGQASPTATDSPATQEAVVHNEADTEFVQMMIVHHEGAIEMADLIVERASTAQVRELGERIRDAQGPEIEQMTGWLEAWGEELPSGMDHGGMDHDGMDMGGMDQQEAMQALADAEDAEVDRLFLELMIEHHRGAIEMAQSQVENGQNADAIALAEDIITAQEAEITEMEQMLDESWM
ncbi:MULTISPECIES: DUF305 domain-containing protein [Miniimonas]